MKKCMKLLPVGVRPMTRRRQRQLQMVSRRSATSPPQSKPSPLQVPDWLLKLTI